MNACEVPIRTDFPVSSSNLLQDIATRVKSVTDDALEATDERIQGLRDALERLRVLRHKHVGFPIIDPFYVDEQLWNWALDKLHENAAELQAEVDKLESAVSEFRNILDPILAKTGNPQKLQDVADALREGIGDQGHLLAEQVKLSKLSVDNGWHSHAAERYTERAQDQGDLGLEYLATLVGSVTTALEDHADTEAEFWNGVADLAIGIAVTVVGIVVAIESALVALIGLILAIPTGGAGLVVAAVGMVVAILGLVVSAGSALLVLYQAVSLINDADGKLVDSVATINAGKLMSGPSWPVLATLA